jgi:beta-1,4-mannosyl-glycoprotein beta-1,4-N-acetylglucosaminyltransferase
MSNCLVFEDGILIKNTINGDALWDGLFSKVLVNGFLVKYIQTCLKENTVFIIPKSDGNINRNKCIDDNKYHDVEWDTQIQPYIDYAKQKNKVFILGVLSQNNEEKDINYIYLPLDDDIFNYGINNCNNLVFNKDNLPLWKNKKNELCWRGSCSGIGGLESLRVRFCETIYKYKIDTDIRLSKWWSENKNIPVNYFADRINYTEFLKYKIFFIVDGNCISSSHMYGFASGSIPFLISNTNSKFWFSHLIIPYIHYIPINFDLSNLIEQIEWVANNDNDAKKIADNALLFAETYFSTDYQKQYIKDKIDNILDNILDKANKIKNTESSEITITKHNSDKKIIDCFLFYNELDLLLYRLTILYDIVDNFVLVESNHTYAGNQKILYYEQNKHLFSKFQDKIIHIVVDALYITPNINYHNNDQWKNENFQRNSIDNGIKQILLDKNDLIIISDLDEITDPDILKKLKKNIIEIKDCFALSQDMYFYNLNTIHCEKWVRSKIVTYEKYIAGTPQQFRDNYNFPILMNSGWHLSYFGDAKFIKNKLQEFSHQEYNNNFYTNENNIENKIKNNIDLFNRSYVPIKYISIDDNKYLPPLYEKYLLNYVKNNI